MNRLMKKYNLLTEAEKKKLADKPKSYAGPATEFLDPEQASEIETRVKEAKKLVEWKGDEDIENLSHQYLEYLFSSSRSAA